MEFGTGLLTGTVCPHPPWSFGTEERRLSTIIKTCRARFSPLLEGEHETLARGTKTIAGPLLEVQEAGGSSGLPFHAVCYPGNQNLASTVRGRELAQTPQHLSLLSDGSNSSLWITQVTNRSPAPWPFFHQHVAVAGGHFDFKDQDSELSSRWYVIWWPHPGIPFMMCHPSCPSGIQLAVGGCWAIM